MSSPPSTHQNPLEKILILVRDERVPSNSFTWRIWPGGTSFYIKSTAPGLEDMKLSLHGPRPDAPGPGPWLKFGPDRSVQTSPSMSVGRWNLPLWFGGLEVRPGVRHCVRLRFDWTMFRRGVPSGPNPGGVKRPGRAQAGVVRWQARPGRALDVDLFVSDGAPCWPEEARVLAKDAAIGPVENKAGQWLTGEVHERRLSTEPTWLKVRVSAPPPPTQAVRALGVGVDDEQRLWINEVALNREEMSTLNALDDEAAQSVMMDVPPGFTADSREGPPAEAELRYGLAVRQALRAYSTRASRG